MIPLPVLQLLLDVGRQGHLPQTFQHLQEDPLVFKAHQTVSALQLCCHLGSELTVAKCEPGARLHLPSRPHQTLPGLLSPVDEQQHLTGAAAGQPLAQQAGRQHPGVVQNQAVAWVQKIRQFVKMMMPHLAAGPIQGHETGRIPPLDRRLGNKFLGKFIKEITCFHAVAVLTRWLHP